MKYLEKIVKRLLASPLEHLRLSYLKTKLSSYNKARKILSSVNKSSNLEVVIVFDMTISALGYGEVFYSAMLARYMALCNKKVRFVFISGEIQNDFKTIYQSNEVSLLLIKFTEMVSVILAQFNVKPEVMDFDSFSHLIENKKQNLPDSVYVVFEDLVKQKKTTYNYVFNILNFLLYWKDGTFKNDFLLTSKEISKYAVFNHYVKPYVTMACRFSKYSLERNSKEADIINIYNYLRSKYPNFDIMVVTDEFGRDSVNAIALKHKLSFIFSKDFSNTYMGDAALVLESHFYFQLFGGGMGTIPMFSNLPYEIYSFIGNEIYWSSKKLMSWQKPEQIFSQPNKAPIERAI